MCFPFDAAYGSYVIICPAFHSVQLGAQAPRKCCLTGYVAFLGDSLVCGVFFVCLFVCLIFFIHFFLAGILVTTLIALLGWRHMRFGRTGLSVDYWTILFRLWLVLACVKAVSYRCLSKWATPRHFPDVFVHICSNKLLYPGSMWSGPLMLPCLLRDILFLCTPCVVHKFSVTVIK